MTNTTKEMKAMGFMINTRRFLTITLLGLAAASSVGCTELALLTSGDEPPPKVSAPPPRPITMQDMANLCEGKALPQPAKTTPKGSLKRIALFERHGSSDKPGYRRNNQSVLKVWNAKTAGDVGLVACVERTKAELAQTCKFSGGRTLSYHDMVNHIRLIDPSTGKVVAEREAAISGSGGCPSSYQFRYKNEYNGRRYDTTVLAMALPFQPEDAPMPKALHKYQMWQACNGVPFPQATAYDPDTDAWQGIVAKRSGPEPAGPYIGRAADKGEDIRLVACIQRTAKKKRRTCKFTGGRELAIHDGDVKVEMREARTAKVLATKTFAANGRRGCPYSHNFSKDGNINLGRVDRRYDAFLEEFTGKKPPKNMKPKNAKSSSGALSKL